MEQVLVKSHQQYFLSLFLAASAYSCALGQVSDSSRAAEGNGAQPTVETSAAAGSQDLVRAAVIQLIDEFIAYAKQTGEAEQASAWQEYRNELPNGDEPDQFVHVAWNALIFVRQLHDQNILLTARRMSNLILTISAATKDVDAELNIFAQQEAAMLDIDFEEYESAANHARIAVSESDDDPNIDGRMRSMLLGERALTLRKMGNYKEAEQTYLRLRGDVAENSDMRPEDPIGLEIAMASLYADMSDWQKVAESLPKDHSELLGDHREDARRAAAVAKITAKVMLAKGELTKASEFAQRAVDVSQEQFGTASLQRIEALEVLAKVKTAQSQFGEAMELLRATLEARTAVLGADHPSVARTRSEIDALRRREFAAPEPILGAPSDDQPAVADRYGN